MERAATIRETTKPMPSVVKSAPENGLANIEIMKELSGKYGTVRIIKGLRSRNKILELQ